MPKRRAAVIGSGLGGLSCAIRLAHRGWSVDVYDAQDFAGGKAGSIEIEGYRFDIGPSLVTMPHVFSELFDEVGENMETYFRLIPLDEICRYWFADGTTLSSYNDQDKFAAEVEGKTADTVSTLQRYLKYSKRIYTLTEERFLWNSLHELSSYQPLPTARSVLSAPMIDPFRTMDRANRSFFKDQNMVQFFNRYATYNGSNPFKAPATINIIPHVEYGTDGGACAVVGGIYAIPKGLKKLAEEKGVSFFLSHRVTRVLWTGGKHRIVRGVEVDGGEREYEVVVSNADVLHTYRDLLADEDARMYRRYQRLEPSSSGLVFYFGMSKQYSELGIHNIFFSDDYEREFTDIFEEMRCPDDPTIYVNITSKVTTEDAPLGGENWFVLVNAPHVAGQDWHEVAQKTRKRVISTIGDRLGGNIEDSIAVEDVMTPMDIQERTGSTKGSLYGISSNSKLAAFLRHSNRNRRYNGLYHCGGSVHPGGGMPLVVLSGKIAADSIGRYHG